MKHPDRIGQYVRVHLPDSPTLDGAEGVTIPGYGNGLGSWPAGKVVVMIIGGPFVTEHDVQELEVIEHHTHQEAS